MHLVLIGCEYSGTSTLALAISNWTKEAFGVGGFGFHDHWKIPHLNHPPAETPEESDAAFQAWAEGRGEDPTMMGYDDEEQTLLLALTPKQKEAFQRYHMEYHVSPTFYSYDHHNLVGMHIDEAVYAGLYYGYGGDGEYADRKQYARHVEETMIERAPDTVLALCKASPDVIRRRMNENPHPNAVVQEKDVDMVVARFEEEYELSRFENKFTVDTGTQSVEDSLAEFVCKYEPYISDADRMKMLVQGAKRRGEWV
jgi:hypothetical protein